MTTGRINQVAIVLMHSSTDNCIIGFPLLGGAFLSRLLWPEIESTARCLCPTQSTPGSAPPSAQCCASCAADASPPTLSDANNSRAPHTSATGGVPLRPACREPTPLPDFSGMRRWSRIKVTSSQAYALRIDTGCSIAARHRPH
jgi:hypothetical protein